jgi:hypothetical protein
MISSCAISVPERRRILNFLGRVLNEMVVVEWGVRGCNWGAVAVVSPWALAWDVSGVGAQRLARAQTTATDSAARSARWTRPHRRAVSVADLAMPGVQRSFVPPPLMGAGRRRHSLDVDLVVWP